MIFIALALAVATSVSCHKKEEARHGGTNGIDGFVLAAEEAPSPAPGEEAVKTPELKMEVMPVEALKVYSSGGMTRWFSGESYFDENQKLSFGVSGVVSRINVHTGQRLTHERVIARLDDSACKKKLDQLETALAKSKVDAKKAAARLETIENSAQNNAEYLNKLKEARADARNAQKSIRDYEKEIQRTRRMIDAHEIRVSQWGVIKSVNIKGGDKVEAGQTAFLFVPEMPVDVTAELPAILISQVGIGSKGKVRFKKGGVYPAKVLNIGQLSKGPDAAFPVTVRLRHYYENLHSGLEADVSFRFDYKVYKKRFVLPPGAIGKDAEGTFVYVVKPSEPDKGYGILERRAVESGGMGAMGQPVYSGLSDEEIVVIRGIDRLKDGMKVKYK